MIYKNYKRTSRSLSDETKQKISQSLQGRQHTSLHNFRISKGMENYWSNDANFPADDHSCSNADGKTTIEDLI